MRKVVHLTTMSISNLLDINYLILSHNIFKKIITKSLKFHLCLLKKRFIQFSTLISLSLQRLVCTSPYLFSQKY